MLRAAPAAACLRIAAYFFSCPISGVPGTTVVANNARTPDCFSSGILHSTLRHMTSGSRRTTHSGALLVPPVYFFASTMEIAPKIPPVVPLSSEKGLINHERYPPSFARQSFFLTFYSSG